MSVHTVKARMYKPWFKPARIVFDVQEHYSSWYDPSYGNGGGDYVDCVKVVGTYDTAEEATIVRDTLNEYKGEQK